MNVAKALAITAPAVSLLMALGFVAAWFLALALALFQVQGR
jgi:hypothetical protein